MKPLLTLGRVLISLFVIVIVIVIAIEIIASESGEVVVITTRNAVGDARKTRLWVVDHHGSAWLRSGSPQSGWYLRTLANPQIGVQRGKESFAALAQPDVDAKDTINRLMGDKYGWAVDYVGMLFGRDDAVPVRLLANSESE